MTFTGYRRWSGRLLAAALAAASGAPAAAGDLPRLERTDCWFEVPDGHGADCAYLFVAEDRDDPATAELRLPVARLVTPGEAAADDPVLFINGGPGAAAGLDANGIETWWRYVEATGWMRRRDFILMDMRGMGLSSPNLNCPEIERQNGANGFAEWIAELTRTADACRDRLLAEGRKLGAYNSASAARDIADYLRVGGIDAVNIYGASYGTRIAFSLMRDAPQRVRSLILESVLPPDAHLVLQQQTGFAEAMTAIARDCAEDSVCNGRYPHLEQQFLDRLSALNERPVAVEVFDPETSEFRRFDVVGVDLVDVIFDLLYGSEVLRYMPTLIDGLSHGDSAYLQTWVQRYLTRTSLSDTGSEGAYYGFACAEQVAHTDLGEAAGLAALHPLYNDEGIVGLSDYFICPRWPVPAASAIERQPVVSELPVLLLSGEYDPVTPPAFADRAAAHLPNGYHYVFPQAGHAPLTHSACANEIAEAFLDDPTQRPKADCLGAVN
jgi:pimeloyl-ACP methyl ester carboxylesterase